jgi:hypothetical protein
VRDTDKNDRKDGGIDDRHERSPPEPYDGLPVAKQQIPHRELDEQLAILDLFAQHFPEPTRKIHRIGVTFSLEAARTPIRQRGRCNCGFSVVKENRSGHGSKRTASANAACVYP